MFELIQVAENTFYINCPAKMGVYRLFNNKVILVDSGNDKDAGRKILKIINENNWTLEAIINTHSNADHIGGNKFLSDRTGCKIYTTGIEKAFCEFPVLEPAFLFGGFPNKYLRHKFLFAEPSRVEDITGFILPQNMEIFPLKGHYFDMIGVKTPDDVYFMADCVSSETILEKYHISFIYDVAEYLKTLDKIEQMNGKVFIPAHTDVIETMKHLAGINRQKVFEIIENIKQICEEDVSFEEILKKIFDNYNLTMDITQYVLAGSTIKSYLSYLLDNNIVKIKIQDNNLLWKTV
ncbi:MAG: MBL fold metallo-hydrolase [Spirochaetaceae bacterium]|nr:MBL fold metallo-hydrolase [Spirochaetaceae bacterium]